MLFANLTQDKQQACCCVRAVECSVMQPENLEAAEPFYQRTWKLVQEALDAVPQELHGVKLKPPPPVRFLCGNS